MIDSADFDDGALKAKVFEQQIQKKTVAWLAGEGSSFGPRHRVAGFSRGSFGAEAYTNLILRDCARSAQPGMSLIGLRFLARHLVTFDFPERKMFLQRRRSASLNEWADSYSNYALWTEAGNFLWNLNAAGQLPGILKNEIAEMSVWMPHTENQEVHPISTTFVATKKGDALRYLYTVVQNSKDSPWKLQKAWRADSNGHIVGEYPVP